MGRELVLAILLLSAASQLTAAFTDGLLKNGNFEIGPNPSMLSGSRINGRDAIPQWHTSGFIEYIKSGHKQGDMTLVIPQGAAAVRLGNEASIKQRGIKVVAGKLYSITFSAARTCAQNEQFNISVAPYSDIVPIQTVYSSNGWDSYAWAWRAKTSEADIIIHNPGASEDPACGPLIDSVAMKQLHPLRVTHNNLLKNGDFEEGPYFLPNTNWGVLIPPNTEDARSPLLGWSILSLKAVKYLDSDHFAIPHGTRAVELLAGKESVVAQELRTSKGRTYFLTFAVGDASNTCKGSMVVEAFAARDTVKVPYESKGTGGSKRASLRFTAVADKTRVVFLSSFYHTRSDDQSSLCGPVIDDVAVVSFLRH